MAVGRPKPPKLAASATGCGAFSGRDRGLRVAVCGIIRGGALGLMLRGSQAMRLLLIAAAVLMLVASIHAAPTSGTMEEFRPAASTIAKAVVKVLKSRRENSITVGQFSGPPNAGTSAGAGIKRLIVEELERAKIKVEKLGTPIGLSGEYRLVAIYEGSETKNVQIEAKLTDESGAVLTDLASNVVVPEFEEGLVKKDQGKVQIATGSSPEATALVMGMTIDFDDYHRRQFGDTNRNIITEPIDAIKEASANPSAFIVGGNELRASQTSPYGFQVLVNGAPRALRIEKGQPFVSLAKGEVFRIILKNQSALTTSAVVTLDGINSFSFSKVRKADGKSKFSQWIVNPKQSLDLAGWHLDNSKVREFKLTDFSDSAAALAGADGQIGMISVVVRATWKIEENPPSDEIAMPGSGIAAAPGPAVGFGDEIEQNVKEDRDERAYGRVRSVMTIRYDRPEE
jgi:hypothetical protein